MANDFAVIHVYTDETTDAQAQVAALIGEYLSARGYTPVTEASLNPYDPRLNLVGQRSRSLYISAVVSGWVSIVDEDIFRLDEPTAEALLAQLSARGPTILVWSIDQFVWGYTIAAAGRILDRYTEDFIELDAYNPTFLHAPGLRVEQQAPRYAGNVAALAQFMGEITKAGRTPFALTNEVGKGVIYHAPTDDKAGRTRFAPTDDVTEQVLTAPAQTQHSALSTQHSVLTRAEHYIGGYRQYYHAAADNEITYMDELIVGKQIYADAWAKELAADLGVSQPELIYSALVRAEANSELPTGWQAATYRRPAIHQPNYSVALTLYCSEPLTGESIARVLSEVTASLPRVGKQGWNEIEMAGSYYPDANAALEKLRAEGLAEGEHLAARYYPGCNLLIQRRDNDLPLDVILLEYPSIIDDSYTLDVLESAPEVVVLQQFVFSGNLSILGHDLSRMLSRVNHPTYGYISVAGGGVGGDGGGRANGPGAMLADALAKPLAQLSSRVAVKEAASWRERWQQLENNIRGVYWANLLSTAQLQQIGDFTTQPGNFILDDAGTGVTYIQLPCSLAEYADGKAEADIERLREALLPLLEPLSLY